jgi:hypothetical protein
MPEPIFVTIGGIIAVTLIDVIGSITSRKLDYNYSYLAPLSFIVFFLVGYISTLSTGSVIAVLGSSIVGLYDGTVGFSISNHLNANYGKASEKAKNTTLSQSSLWMLLVSSIAGYIGYLVATS